MAAKPCQQQPDSCSTQLAYVNGLILTSTTKEMTATMCAFLQENKCIFNYHYNDKESASEVEMFLPNCLCSQQEADRGWPS